MECKDCDKMPCEHRSANGSCIELTDDSEIVKNIGLRFADNRIYQMEEHQNPYRHPYEVKVDVTEEILDMFLKILEKRSEEAYQATIIRQLKGNY